MRCLGALAELRTDGSLEVIVVDDGSPTPLAPVVARFQDRLDTVLIRQDNAGPAAARNAGAAAARHPFLAFTDDDCQPAVGWLEHLGQTLAAHPDALVGGHTRNALRHNPFSEASQQLVAFLTDYYAAPGRNAFFASNNIAVSAEDFAAFGGFDKAFPLAAGEDRDFCDRWSASGRPTVYVPAAVVEHTHRLTPASFIRQHVNYGRGAYRYHRVRGSASIPEPLSFYGRLVSYPLQRRARRGRLGGIPQAILSVALLSAAQVANVAGFAAEGVSIMRASRRRPS